MTEPEGEMTKPADKHKQFSFDVNCLNLAKLFLSDIGNATKKDVGELAQAIQDVCEDACIEIEART